MEILIVDDSPVALELLRHVLTQNGYAVRTAVDGQEALKSLDAHECQMVITDWEMPRMSGVELCQAIRQSGSSGYVYTILLTSRNQTADTVTGLTAGADDFVAKPFQPAELLARVRTGERILQLETRDLTIFALAKLAESRDPETGAHLERVRNYSKILAQHLSTQPAFREQVNSEFVRLIYLTSPLHDIGKVAIPDGVLLKPGRLEPAEFEIMKTHALHGAATLEAALAEYPRAKYLQMARDIAACHHEKFAGGGYPRGLRGAEIPLSARIVSVADVYDALTSKRVYKEAFSHQRAREIILQGSGTDFDPAIVQAFLACEDRFQEIQELFAEELQQVGHETVQPGAPQLGNPQAVPVS